MLIHASNSYWAEGWLVLYRFFEARFVLRETGGVLPPGWLDAGAGEGRFARLLKLGAEKYGAGIGVDADQGRLLSGSHDQLYSETFSVDLRALTGLKSEITSLVLCNSVLEHVARPEEVVNEFHRLLKKGGRLVLTIPSDDFERLLAGSQALTAVGLGRAARWYGRRMSRHIAHLNYWSLDSAREMLESAGFTITAEDSFGTPAFSAIGDLMHLVRIVGIGGSRFSRLPPESLARRSVLNAISRAAKSVEVRSVRRELQRLSGALELPTGVICLSAVRR